MREQVELQFIANVPYFLAVDKDAPLELKVKLGAALTAHALRNRSIHYTLKRYGEAYRLQLINEGDERPSIVVSFEMERGYR